MYATTRIAGAVVVILALVAVAVTERPLSLWGSPVWESITRLGLLGIAVLLAWLVRRDLRRSWRAAETPLAPATPIPDVRQVPFPEQQKDILAAIALVVDRYDRRAIALFVRMLTNNHYRLRITERAELLGTSLRMHVANDYVMSAADRDRLEERLGKAPKSPCASIPVPLLNESKGELSDNLDVTDGGGESISLLSRKEAQGLVALALETLFYLTFDRAEPGTPEDIAQTAALWTLQRIVSRTGRLEPVDEETAQVYTHEKLHADFHGAVKALRAPEAERLRDIENFCWYFAINNMVVADAPAPKGNRFVVKYSKTIPLESPSHRRDRLRARLGLVPYRFHVPLNLAFAAESYHFRMDIGESQYVSDHYITRPDGEPVNREELVEITNGGHVRVQHGTALPYAHLYTRGLNDAPVHNLLTAVRFTETPPGALGAAMVVAAVSAIVIAILTFIPPTGDGPNADTSALLLAVPLFATTLVGHSIERVQRSSLTTYVGLIITGATAFVGAAIFGLIPGKTSITDVNLSGLFVVPSVNLVGLALSVIGAANMIYLKWLQRYHAERYLEMLTKRSNLDGT
ncbi:MAG: hypothetical protein WBA97_00385 [Actinophytocola sp.]|uniref:hypothetical protein n=1 Tax=Actinophytocola sp. TaxID=1872138 RepID=UPI003C713CAD